MLKPVTYPLSIGTAQESSEPRSFRFAVRPASRMLGMMKATWLWTRDMGRSLALDQYALRLPIPGLVGHPGPRLLAKSAAPQSAMSAVSKLTIFPKHFQ
jgi:hypothetical protein